MRTQTSAEAATPVADTSTNPDRRTEHESTAASTSTMSRTSTASASSAAPTAGGDSPIEEGQATSQPEEPQEADVIRLTLPAASSYVTVLRSTTAALAARIDFTIDEIEDLRIAVDEACALLLAQAVRGSDLSCTFRLSGNQLSFSVTAESSQPRVPSRDSFAWTVLTALVSDVEAAVDGDGGHSTLTLTKHAIAVRAGAHGGPGPQQDESRDESTDQQSPSS